MEKLSLHIQLWQNIAVIGINDDNELKGQIPLALVVVKLSMVKSAPLEHACAVVQEPIGALASLRNVIYLVVC
jgi:acyl-coenzyme A synthetase/AMP-(fatty) acid ligase